MSNKKFKVKWEGRIKANTDENSKFKIQSETRPKKCPICLTPDKITRSTQEDKRWLCQACEHNW